MLTDKITYGDGAFDAIAMGIMESLPMMVGVGLAGVCVTFVASGPRPERWAIVIGLLYVASHLGRTRWGVSPIEWFQFYKWAHLLSPAIACVATAAVTARLRHNHPSAA
jgi:hypothetical protein